MMEGGAMFGISGADLKLYTMLVLAAIVAYFLIRELFRRIGRKLPASTSTWRSYLRGQGTLLFGFLCMGGILASLTSYFGPWEGNVAKGGRLVEYRQLNPSEHVIYEEQDVRNYRRISVLARTMAPQNASTTVTIYGDPQGSGKQEINRIENVTDSWSRWDHPQNSSKHITLKITNGGTAPGATDVDVLLYLFPE
jgi:hypothetical protein